MKPARENLAGFIVYMKKQRILRHFRWIVCVFPVMFVTTAIPFLLLQHHLMIEFLTEARHYDIQIFLLILRVITPYIGLLQIRIHQVVVLLAIHNNDTITKLITKAVPSRTTWRGL